MKDKAARDQYTTRLQLFAAQLSRRPVLASPRDADRWAPPYYNARGRPFFVVTLMPPHPLNSTPCWSVRCAGADDTSLVRFFGADETKARRVYSDVNDFTMIKTLLGRGFRFD